MGGPARCEWAELIDLDNKYVVTIDLDGGLDANVNYRPGFFRATVVASTKSTASYTSAGTMSAMNA